ncbi:hypothetical protein J2X14_002078 [Pantoea alhagi]|nr:hypothetical protein [Pantoea alhagi]
MRFFPLLKHAFLFRALSRLGLLLLHYLAICVAGLLSVLALVAKTGRLKVIDAQIEHDNVQALPIHIELTQSSD